MKHRRRLLCMVLLALPLLLAAGGCSRNSDKWGEDISAPAADINELRRKAAEKRKADGKPPAPARPGMPGSGSR